MRSEKGLSVYFSNGRSSQARENGDDQMIADHGEVEIGGQLSFGLLDGVENGEPGIEEGFLISEVGRGGIGGGGRGGVKGRGWEFFGEGEDAFAGVLGDEAEHERHGLFVGGFLGSVFVFFDPTKGKGFNELGDGFAEDGIELAFFHAIQGGDDGQGPGGQVVLEGEGETSEAAVGELDEPVSLGFGKGRGSGLLREPVGENGLRQGRKGDALAATADGGKETVLIRGDEDDVGPGGRFFEGFEEEVLATEVDEFGFVDDEDFVVMKSGCSGDGDEEMFGEDIQGDVDEFTVADLFVGGVAGEFLNDDVKIGMCDGGRDGIGGIVRGERGLDGGEEAAGIASATGR